MYTERTDIAVQSKGYAQTSICRDVIRGDLRALKKGLYMLRASLIADQSLIAQFSEGIDERMGEHLRRNQWTIRESEVRVKKLPQAARPPKLFIGYTAIPKP